MGGVVAVGAGEVAVGAGSGVDVGDGGAWVAAAAGVSAVGSLAGTVVAAA